MAKKNAKKRKTPNQKIIVPELDADGNVASPVETHDKEDPGDEMQRALRYQHGYGVLLLIGIASGRLPYLSIWCEQHDDYLGQRNGMFDSIQVKTRQPELGYWELTNTGFISAIKKFATQETRFPERIDRYKFVSNAKSSNSAAKTKVNRAPQRLLVAISVAESEGDLAPPFDESLATLAEACQSTTACVFRVLKRLDLVEGPSRDDIETVLSHTHVASLEACASFAPHQLNAIRDEMLQKVADASCIKVEDPAKHWCCVNGTAVDDPRVQSKQLFPSVVDESIQAKSPPYFRYSDIATKTDQRLTDNNLSTLEKKLLRGNLRQQLETMKRRTISAEQHLLELAAAKPHEIRQIRNQLESVVQGVCDDASLQSQVDGQVSGRDMMRVVLAELKERAREQPNNVHQESYDCLVGMSGLLTEDCAVWWSEVFDLQEATR